MTFCFLPNRPLSAGPTALVSMAWQLAQFCLKVLRAYSFQLERCCSLNSFFHCWCSLSEDGMVTPAGMLPVMEERYIRKELFSCFAYCTEVIMEKSSLLMPFLAEKLFWESFECGLPLAISRGVSLMVILRNGLFLWPMMSSWGALLL